MKKSSIILCTILGCSRKNFSRGLCSPHYCQWYRDSDEYSHERATWDRMKSRCYNKNYQYYGNYGGRGIVVCDDWLYDFNAFLEYVGKRPSNKHSLDRIDNNGNYEPGNVRWATFSQQQLNKRVAKNNPSGYTGVQKSGTKKKWTTTFKGVVYGTYDTIEEAIAIRIMVES